MWNVCKFVYQDETTSEAEKVESRRTSVATDKDDSSRRSSVAKDDKPDSRRTSIAEKLAKKVRSIHSFMCFVPICISYMRWKKQSKNRLVNLAEVYWAKEFISIFIMQQMVFEFRLVCQT